MEYQGKISTSIRLIVSLSLALVFIFGCGQKTKEEQASSQSMQTSKTSESSSSSSSTPKDDGSFEEAPKDDQVGETEGYYEALNFTGGSRLYSNGVDSYGRPNYNQILLTSADQPSKSSNGKITFDVKGYHDYTFKYKDKNGKVKESALMLKSPLIPYSFTGVEADYDQVVPMTYYLKNGTMSDKETNPDNPYSLLFYETALNEWLKEHPGYSLDYFVTPEYKGAELFPRSITLFWTAYDPDGNQIKVDLKDPGKATYDGIKGHVTLLNVSKNAKINYKTGEAIPVIK